MIGTAEFLLLAASIGLIPAFIARSKGYNFGLWWFLGAAVFIAALPIALLMKRNPARLRQCPLCRTWIASDARVCPQCHRDVFEYLAAGGRS